MTTPVTTPLPLSYDIDAAAARLGAAVTPDWLRKHLHEIPHTRSGRGRGRAGRIAFTETHLAEILLMLEQRPDDLPAPSTRDDFADAIVSRGGRRSS